MMPFNKALADKILEFAALEPTIPVGTGHDFHNRDFDEDDFEDTAKQLISSGQIKAELQEDFAGLYLAFRN